MKTLTFGGWYQRTTLHLTEVHQFLSEGKSKLELNQDKLNVLRNNLGITDIKRVPSYLEYIEVKTKYGIKIKYFEDGLYVFQINSKEVDNDSIKLKKYFEEKWQPAINYLFSLGAPTPKILSNMEEFHPIVLGETSVNPKSFKMNENVYGKIYSDISSKSARNIKTNKYLITIISERRKNRLDDLIEMQIFFREFKLQLHKYLNIHRKIWEEISEIKEKKEILGKDAEEYRIKLDSYQKTIRLIGNRINQMGTYAKTRASLSKELGVEEELVELFRYKYEDLFNTLEYIKEIWNMTKDYVNSAIEIVNEVKTKSAVSGIKSIQLLASVGAVAGIVRLANPKSIPILDANVAIFLIALFGISWFFDWYLKYRTKHKTYKLKFIERTKDI